ncbi:hypothetical protein KKI24_04535 [bacterium]|nr:hypothetical protein [bacterium]
MVDLMMGLGQPHLQLKFQRNQEIARRIRMNAGSDKQGQIDSSNIMAGGFPFCLFIDKSAGFAILNV